MQENGKSKTALCIEMLQLLNSGRTYKVSELAEELETKPRNIIEYKKELEEARYAIINKAGKYGGYKLDKTYTIPSLKFTEDEKRILQVAIDFIKSHGDFLDSSLYQKAMAKVFSSISSLPKSEETPIIPGVTFTMSNEEMNKRFNIIRECIEKKQKLSIDYLSIDNEVRTRVIHPYKLFIFHNAWFVIGYCELRKTFRYFKLTRIENFSIISKKFSVSILYNEHDYFDEKGFKVGRDWSKDLDDTTAENVTDDWVHIKLEFSGPPAMYVKEYKFGENQVVTPIDKNTTILECDMHYRYSTIKFVLGFGLDCKVLEPQWLKEEVVSIAKKMCEDNT